MAQYVGHVVTAVLWSPEACVQLYSETVGSELVHRWRYQRRAVVDMTVLKLNDVHPVH